MLNFGLNELNLIKPRDAWPNIKANATSAGALEDNSFKVEVLIIWMNQLKIHRILFLLLQEKEILINQF